MKKKYEHKQDQASQVKMQQEMMELYKKYNFNPYYISTGGGASLNYLSGIELPALKIMED